MHTRRRITRNILSNSEPIVLVDRVIATRSSSQPPESIEPLSDSQFEETVLNKANENQSENTNVNTRITRQTNLKCLRILQKDEQSSQKKRISPKINRYQSSLRNLRFKSNSQPNITSFCDLKSPDLNLSTKSNTTENNGWGETQVGSILEINESETTENTFKTIVNSGWGETQTIEKFPDDTQTVEDNQPVEQDSNVTISSPRPEQVPNNTQPSSSTDIENNTSLDNENESNQTGEENTITHNNSSSSSVVEDITQIVNYIRQTSNTSSELFDTQISSPEKNTQMVWEDILSNHPEERENNTNGKKVNEDVQENVNALQESENIQGDGNNQVSNKNTESNELLNLLEGNLQNCAESNLTRTEQENINTEEHSIECIESSDPRTKTSKCIKSDPRTKTSKTILKDQDCGTSSRRVEESDSQSSDGDGSTDDAETHRTNKENEKLLMYLCYHSFELLDFSNDVIWKRIGAKPHFKDSSWQVYKENFFNNLVERIENYKVPVYFSKYMRETYVNNTKPGGKPAVLKIRSDLYRTQKGPNFNNTLNETSQDKVRTPTKNNVRTPTKNRNDGEPNTKNNGEKVRTPSKKGNDSDSVERNSGGSEGNHNQTPSKGPNIKHTTGRHCSKEKTPLKKSRDVNRISSDSSSDNEEMVDFLKKINLVKSKNQTEKVYTRKSESDLHSSDSSIVLDIDRSRIITRKKTGKSTNPSPNKSKKDQTVGASDSGDNSEGSEYNPFQPLRSKYKQNRRHYSSPTLDTQSRKRSSRNSGGKTLSPTSSSRGTKRARTSQLEYVNKSSDSEMSDSGSVFRYRIGEQQGSSRSKDKQSQSNNSKTKENARESTNRSQNQSQSQSKTSQRNSRDGWSSIGSILTPPPRNPQSHVRTARMPYLSYEKVNMIKYLKDNTSSLDTIKGNVFWKEMEGAGAVPGRTWQSLKNHFFRSMVFELDTYSLDTKFRQKLKLYSAR